MQDKFCNLPTPEQLREQIHYEPTSGRLTWKGNKGGAEVGCHTNEGYRHFRFGAVTIRSHRAAWAMHYGEWPSGQIDHINGIRDDNRIANLRVVSVKQNCQNRRRNANNSSGQTGVHWDASEGRWRAKIQGKHLGLYSNFNDAVTARKAAEKECGFHENHGRPPIKAIGE